MAEKILIPLDGSKLGEVALHYIEGMVSRLTLEKKVDVILFHVITTLTHDISISGGDAGTITVPYREDELEKMKADAEKYLDKAGGNLRDQKAGVLTKVVIGKDAADEIIKAEAEVNVDLVAMSTHGRAGISRWALGSVTDKVLRAGNVPVLMVRAKQ
jgi:nucleotide-binding universal stress UspA family protein